VYSRTVSSIEYETGYHANIDQLIKPCYRTVDPELLAKEGHLAVPLRKVDYAVFMFFQLFLNTCNFDAIISCCILYVLLYFICIIVLFIFG